MSDFSQDPVYIIETWPRFNPRLKEPSLKDATMFQGLIKWFNRNEREVSLNTEAFSEFYDQTYLSVFRYLYGLHGGPVEDVEDLTAETFTRAWKARQTFTGELNSNAVGWLLRIARRLVIDRYRKEENKNQDETDLPDDFPTLGPTPEHLLIQDERYQILWGLLQDLSGRQREILTLRYFLDWRVNQIAGYLQIPENTVSVTIHRTLAQLQHEWPTDKE